MSCTPPTSIYRRIFEQLGRTFKKIVADEDIAVWLQHHLTSVRENGSLCIVVIEELDQLDNGIVYRLFDWAASCMVLVGVGNKLDFVARDLPRLQTSGYQIDTVHVAAYTSQQINTILQDQWRDLITSSAIELCARKVAAAASGDLRKATSICNSAAHLAKPEAATTMHIMLAMTNLVGQATSSAAASLNLQQRALLMCMVKMKSKHTRPQNWTIRGVHCFYTDTLQRTKSLDPVNLSGVCDLLSGLEMAGMISIGRAAKDQHDIKDRRVTLSEFGIEAATSAQKINILHELLD